MMTRDMMGEGEVMRDESWIGSYTNISRKASDTKIRGDFWTPNPK